MKNNKKIEANENTMIRYCKKCGCELRSDNKSKKCDNCKRKDRKGLRNVGGVIIGILTVIPVVKHFVKK